MEKEVKTTKLDLTEDKATKMTKEITTMNKILKTAATHKEEVTLGKIECLQMVVVTMVMMIDLKVMVIKIKTTYSRMKEGQ